MIDDRLNSGMTAKEAVRRASAWWDKTGRHIMNKRVNEERAAPKVYTGGNAPAIIVQGAVQQTLPSGILNALPWAELTKREQFAVVNIWHNELVVKEKTKAHDRLNITPDTR